MAEQHQIVGPARGEPLPIHHVGARVRVPLDAPPSRYWSRILVAHLATGLTGHPAVGYLTLNRVVEGADIVLEGVETREAALLGPVLLSAIDAANCACAATDDHELDQPLNMDSAQADEVARAVTASTANPAGPATVDPAGASTARPAGPATVDRGGPPTVRRATASTLPPADALTAHPSATSPA